MAIVNFRNRSTSGFDEDVLMTSTSGEHIFNFGRLTSTGDLADGIFADANNVSIRNFGRIETSGLGAAGIFANGEDARIENYGSVTTHGGFFDPDPNVDGDEFFSEGLFANGDGFHIANFGSVRVEGLFTSAMVGVGADGIVANYGRIDSASDGSAVIAAIGDESQAINAGHVTAHGAEMTIFRVRGEDAVGVNHGLVEATGEAAFGMLAQLRNAHLTNDGVIRIDSDNSFAMISLGDGQKIDNFGKIETHGTFAVGVAGAGGLFFPDGQDIDIVNGGRIATEGDLAFGVALGFRAGEFFSAIDGTIVNRGMIDTAGDGAAGVVMIGDGHHLTNSGRITTDGGAFDSDIVGLFRAAGVVVSGDDALVENTRSGVIRSDDAASAAVELNVVERDGFPTAFMSSQLDNFGFIGGECVAVQGGAGQETVVNRGRIVGDVVLDEGADTFVFGKGGSVAGDVFLGGGDDHVVVENGSGRSHIADFAAGAASGDVIDVSDFFANFDQLTAHSHQRGDDVVITLDHNDTLVLDHMRLNVLTVGDFVF